MTQVADNDGKIMGKKVCCVGEDNDDYIVPSLNTTGEGGIECGTKRGQQLFILFPFDISITRAANVPNVFTK